MRLSHGDAEGNTRLIHGRNRGATEGVDIETIRVANLEGDERLLERTPSTLARHGATTASLRPKPLVSTNIREQGHGLWRNRDEPTIAALEGDLDREPVSIEIGSAEPTDLRDPAASVHEQAEQGVPLPASITLEPCQHELRFLAREGPLAGLPDLLLAR